MKIWKIASGKVICPSCSGDVSSDGERPAMLNDKKTLMCPCGARVTETGELVPEGAPLVKVKKKAPTFDLAELAIPGTAEKWLSQSNFDLMF
jgi:hypothetical protein